MGCNFLLYEEEFMKRRYPLIIERGKEIYAGYFPDLPGYTTSGETPEEVS